MEKQPQAAGEASLLRRAALAGNPLQLITATAATTAAATTAAAATTQAAIAAAAAATTHRQGRQLTGRGSCIALWPQHSQLFQCSRCSCSTSCHSMCSCPGLHSSKCHGVIASWCYNHTYMECLSYMMHHTLIDISSAIRVHTLSSACIMPTCAYTPFQVRASRLHVHIHP